MMTKTDRSYLGPHRIPAPYPRLDIILAKKATKPDCLPYIENSIPVE